MVLGRGWKDIIIYSDEVSKKWRRFKGGIDWSKFLVNLTRSLNSIGKTKDGKIYRVKLTIKYKGYNEKDFLNEALFYIYTKLKSEKVPYNFDKVKRFLKEKFGNNFNSLEIKILKKELVKKEGIKPMTLEEARKSFKKIADSDW